MGIKEKSGVEIENMGGKKNKSERFSVAKTGFRD